MRRSFASLLSAGLIAGASIVLFANAANANSYAHEDHCFPKGPTSSVRDVQDDYVNGTLQNQSTVDAVEQLNSRLWKLRLSNLPIQQARREYTKAQRAAREHLAENGNSESRNHHLYYHYNGYWGSAYTAERFREAEERDSRRTGSKYLYVTPSQKQLARERSMIRNLEQKPCNPNITYLGSF